LAVSASRDCMTELICARKRTDGQLFIACQTNIL